MRRNTSIGAVISCSTQDYEQTKRQNSLHKADIQLEPPQFLLFKSSTVWKRQTTLTIREIIAGPYITANTIT